MSMAPIDIRYELRKAGYTQKAVADMLDVSPPTVSLVIDGNTQSTRIQKAIAKIIKKPVEEVFVQPRQARPGPKPKM